MSPKTIEKSVSAYIVIVIMEISAYSKRYKRCRPIYTKMFFVTSNETKSRTQVLILKRLFCDRNSRAGGSLPIGTFSYFSPANGPIQQL